MRTRIEVLVVTLTLVALPALGQATRNQHRPVWSPDDGSLVFMSDRSLDWELYTMKLDGSRLQRLTNHLGWDGYASVVEDGSAILYDRRDEAFTIVLRNSRAGTETVVVSESVFTGSPRWLPGGERFLFVSEKGGNRDIYSARRDGTDVRKVTDTPENEHDPAPSPDGKRLLMAINLEEGSALDIMNLDGTDRTRIVRSSGDLYGTAWSPDGMWITFNTDEDGDQEIYKIRPDGTGRVRLTDNDENDRQADWSPDGSLLCFTSQRNGREEIFLMDPDGKNVVRLATD